MSCDNHTGCDFGCGACSWQDAVKYERYRIINQLLELKPKDPKLMVVATVFLDRLVEIIESGENK